MSAHSNGVPSFSTDMTAHKPMASLPAPPTCSTASALDAVGHPATNDPAVNALGKKNSAATRLVTLIFVVTCFVAILAPFTEANDNRCQSTSAIPSFDNDDQKAPNSVKPPRLQSNGFGFTPTGPQQQTTIRPMVLKNASNPTDSIEWMAASNVKNAKSSSVLSLTDRTYVLGQSIESILMSPARPLKHVQEILFSSFENATIHPSELIAIDSHVCQGFGRENQKQGKMNFFER